MMDEQTKKAFDFAADITKQLITVAAAIVTLTVTFSRDTPAAARIWAYAAWFCFLSSILLGFATLMSLAAELQSDPKGKAAVGNPNPSIWNRNIKRFSIGQMGLFFIAVGLSAWFGRVAMHSADQMQTPPGQVCNCVFPASQPMPASTPPAPPRLTPAPADAKGKPLAGGPL